MGKDTFGWPVGENRLKWRERKTYMVGEVGEDLGLIWEALIIDDVPVKNIQLVPCH